MSSKVTPVTTLRHFQTITSSSTYTVVDFYADWCGPCKAMSPMFEQLATAESKPGRIVFCKVDVDSHRDIASRYGVTAMPTFLVLKGTTAKETVRGANVAALRTAVLAAAADAAKGPATQSASFSGPGQTLGSSDGEGNASKRVAGSKAASVGAVLTSPAQFAQGRGLAQTVVRFLGLYLTTLFSLDSTIAAEGSRFQMMQQRRRNADGAKVGSVN